MGDFTRVGTFNTKLLWSRCWTLQRRLLTAVPLERIGGERGDSAGLTRRKYSGNIDLAEISLAKITLFLWIFGKRN